MHTTLKKLGSIKTTDDRTLNKSSRLLWLWIKTQLGEKDLAHKYMEKFEVNRQIAWLDSSHDLPTLHKMLQSEFPFLSKLIKQIFKSGDLNKLPVTRLEGAKAAFMNINVIYDYETSTMTYEPFTQVLYGPEGEILARIEINGGQTKRD